MGRWERTHDALQGAAVELFAEQGYDAVGTAQVAQRAGVSEMTLFRHFPTKESLLLSDPFDPAIAAAVRSRPADEPAMVALTEGIRESWAQLDPEIVGALRTRLRIVDATATLRGAIERNSGATVAALVEALAERGVPAVEAKVAATAVISGLGVALLAWSRTDRPLGAAVGRALDVLRGS